MLIELILALLIGVTMGTLTGLFPGIHINLVAAILLASIPAIPFLQTLPLISLAVFVTAMAITHSFIDFIPSIYLGAPDEDNFLAILPGHQLLQKGLGHKAVVLTLYGSLTALAIILFFTPIFIFILPLISNSIRSFLPYILIFTSFYLIFREKEFLISLVVFILAGFLGFAALNLETIKEPLLPLLTGLFGLSTLFVSLKSKIKIPRQEIPPLKEIKLPKSQIIKSAISASIAAPLCSFLPGIGSGHAAVIGSEIFPHEKESFLFLVGTINTIVIALSFIAVYSIGKTRTGTAAAIKEILNQITLSSLLIIIATVILSGFIAFFLGIQISKIFARNIFKIDYKLLSIIIIATLLLVNILLTNSLGILVLATSTFLGIFAILSGSRRINLMGSLLLPTIIFYLTL